MSRFSSVSGAVKVASIDIGSNTLRLLIAHQQGGQCHPVWRDREIVRLGGHFYPRREIRPEPWAAALQVLKRFQKKARQEGLRDVRAAGTGVLREAANAESFVQAIHRETGLTVHILTGEEEARLSALGVLSVFPPREERDCIFDLGGGSVEFALVRDGHLERSISLGLGVVALTERFLTADPPGMRALMDLEGHCLEHLRGPLSPFASCGRIIGTAGTVTTLAAVIRGMTAYDPGAINGVRLDQETLSRLRLTWADLSLEERRRIRGLEPGRADVIVAGLAVVQAILKVLSRDHLWVSDAGLLEGLLLEKTAP